MRLKEQRDKGSVVLPTEGIRNPFKEEALKKKDKPLMFVKASKEDYFGPKMLETRSLKKIVDFINDETILKEYKYFVIQGKVRGKDYRLLLMYNHDEQLFEIDGERDSKVTDKLFRRCAPIIEI